MNTKDLARRSLAGLLVLAAAACGDGNTSGGAAAPLTVDTGGGTVQGPDGAQVVVPANALGTAVALGVSASGAGLPAVPATLIAVGEVYSFTPHGQVFSVPVTVTVPVDLARVPAGATVRLFKTANGVAGPWEEVAGATLSGRLLSGQVSSFSGLGAFVFGNAPPSIVQQPVAQSVVAPGVASFSLMLTGTPGFEVRWERSDDGGASWFGVGNAQVLTSAPATSSYNTAATSAAPASGGGDDGAAFRALVSNVATLPGMPVVSATATLAVTATVVPPPPPPPPPPPGTSAARIAAGSDFSLAVAASGALYSWGSDAAGVLGAGPGNQTRNQPGLVLLGGVATAAAGSAHGLAVLGSGGGWRAWGYNGFGQLGDGSNLSREAPVNPPFNHPDAVEVCGGALHSLIRLAGGGLRAMGANTNGQLGDGSNLAPAAPPYSVAVSGIGTATAVACRGNHSLALLADGTVRAWGRNHRGQLGDGSTTDRSTPVVVVGLNNVVAIAAGLEHSLALRSDGSVWAWGGNRNGKLGDGGDADRALPTATLLASGITAIAAGSENSLALRASDGVVFSWGINETGQLGSGASTPGFRATPAPVLNLSGVVAIALGSGLGHGMALRSDGTVWTWGDNSVGQLGNGTALPFVLSPVQALGLNLN